MKKTMMVVALGAMVTLSGCVISVGGDDDYDSHTASWSKSQKSNLAVISQLELGTSLKSVESSLGKAEFIELFEKDGETHRVLYFRTHRTRSDGKTTKDECHHLHFVNDKLAAIGEGEYRR